MKKKYLKRLLVLTLAGTLTVGSTVPVSAAWKWGSKGWWNTNNSSRGYSTGWDRIGGKWYYFDNDGWMKTGWALVDGSWYYLQSNGAMSTGWLKLGNKWYYLAGNGAMKIGWLKQGSTWYYLKPDGAMATGWFLDGDTWYYSSGSGAMQTGWKYLGNKWYYLYSSGNMATGWYKVGGKWYYSDSSGAMQTGWKFIDNSWYYLDSSGAMASNKWVGDYYVGGSGAMYTSAITPDGYYVDGNGKWRPNYGTRSNPIDASAPITLDLVEYDENIGNFTIQLLDYYDGEDAWSYIDKYSLYAQPPQAGEEYIYFRFYISYNYGSEEVCTANVVDYFSNLYNSASNQNIENLNWENPDNGLENMVSVYLYPGGKTECQTAILIKSGNTPVTYRIPTGFNKKTWGQEYTWFKVK